MLNPETRISELSRLGFSEPILELSAGRKPHPLFKDLCSDPYYVYHGGRSPLDLTIVPIWEEGMMLTAVLEGGKRSEIIRYSLEMPDEYKVIAYDEQGLWANLFASLIDGWTRTESDMKTVKEATEAVKFLYLAETLDFINDNRDSDDYPELLIEFTKSI